MEKKSKMNTSISNSLANSSFIILKNGKIKKKRLKNSYADTFIDKIRYETESNKKKEYELSIKKSQAKKFKTKKLNESESISIKKNLIESNLKTETKNSEEKKIVNSSQNNDKTFTKNYDKYLTNSKEDIKDNNQKKSTKIKDKVKELNENSEKKNIKIVKEKTDKKQKNTNVNKNKNVNEKASMKKNAHANKNTNVNQNINVNKNTDNNKNIKNKDATKESKIKKEEIKKTEKSNQNIEKNEIILNKPKTKTNQEIKEIDNNLNNNNIKIINNDKNSNKILPEHNKINNKKEEKNKASKNASNKNTVLDNIDTNKIILENKQNLKDESIQNNVIKQNCVINERYNDKQNNNIKNEPVLNSYKILYNDIKKASNCIKENINRENIKRKEKSVEINEIDSFINQIKLNNSIGNESLELISRSNKEKLEILLSESQHIQKNKKNPLKVENTQNLPKNTQENINETTKENEEKERYIIKKSTRMKEFIKNNLTEEQKNKYNNILYNNNYIGQRANFLNNNNLISFSKYNFSNSINKQNYNYDILFTDNFSKTEHDKILDIFDNKKESHYIKENNLRLFKNRNKNLKFDYEKLNNCFDSDYKKSNGNNNDHFYLDKIKQDIDNYYKAKNNIKVISEEPKKNLYDLPIKYEDKYKLNKNYNRKLKIKIMPANDLNFVDNLIYNRIKNK